MFVLPSFQGFGQTSGGSSNELWILFTLTVETVRARVTYCRGGVISSNRLMGMCRWMGSHFHSWIDYNGVPFSLELLEWDRTFSGFW